MTLSAAEKAAIMSLWDKIAPNAPALGAKVFERLLMSSPQTKTHFSDFDLSHGSADLLAHGGKVMNAIGQAVQNLDSLDQTLPTLSDLHDKNLRVDPGNFQLLSLKIQWVLACHFPQDYTATAQTAWAKFLDAVFSDK
ncbi:hemoglobin subunit alpha-3-like [Discoglossus pictus]